MFTKFTGNDDDFISGLRVLNGLVSSSGDLDSTGIAVCCPFRIRFQNPGLFPTFPTCKWNVRIPPILTRLKHAKADVTFLYIGLLQPFTCAAPCFEQPDCAHRPVVSLVWTYRPSPWVLEVRNGSKWLKLIKIEDPDHRFSFLIIQLLSIIGVSNY
jgi:hypothetical protein